MKIISKNILHSLGLNEQQIAVYLAALELGESNMQQLARKSGVKRTSIYNFIEDLKERGLIIEVKKQKHRIYSGVDPKQLLEIEKLRVKELENIMPELLAIQNKSHTKPRVSFYEGIDNVLAVYDDQLKERKPIFAFEDMEYMKMAMPESFYNNWPAERARRNVSFSSITRDSEAAREYTKKNIKLLRKIKLIKTEKPWKTEINIYGDKVALFRFREDHAMTVLIEDHDIAYTLQSIWKEMWNNSNEPIIG